MTSNEAFPVKTRRFVAALLIAVFLFFLPGGFMRCHAFASEDAETDRMLSGASYSTGWAGIDVAYKFKGLSASHVIVKVEEGSPAAIAGLEAGDKILSIGSDNAGYMNILQVSKRIEAADTPLVILVKRTGETAPLSFIMKKENKSPVPTTEVRNGSVNARMRTSQAPIKSGIEGMNNASGLRQQMRVARARKISGADGNTGFSGSPVNDPYAVPGLLKKATKDSGINTLRRIYLDPGTGRLVFAGTYDNKYATGPIDYSALLHDATSSPKPSFSLEPTPLTKTALNDFITDLDQQMPKNFASIESGKAWLMRIFDLLLSDPTLGDDRQRFFLKGADLLKADQSEMHEITQAMLGRRPQGSPAFIRFTSKFYDLAGYPQLAVFIKAAATKDADPDAFMRAVELLGLEPYRQELRAKMQSGILTSAQAEALFQIEFWKKNFIRMGVPESKWQNVSANAQATYNVTTLTKVADEIFADLVRKHFITPWLNGMVFSEKFISRMYQVPLLQSQPVCREGLAPDSELARTFLEADWNLKTLTGRPELARQVPGHLTPHQFLFERESATGQYNQRNIEFRLWLHPESTPLEYDTGKRVVSFDAPSVSIKAEPLATKGNSSVADAMVQKSLAEYGKTVSHRYDSYARALPPLHRLREAQKVLAFVNWARSSNIPIHPPGPPAGSVPLPDKFNNGFWTAHFFADKDKTFLGFAASGGVDYGQNTGNNWINAVENKALGKKAMTQLAVSAVLGEDAVDAALQGNLERARTLADQSAKAMTGDFDFTGNPALEKIPEVPAPLLVSQAELQTEAIRQIEHAVDSLDRTGNTQPNARATRQLQQIKNILNVSSPTPDQVNAWVRLIRNDDGETIAAQKTLPEHRTHTETTEASNLPNDKRAASAEVEKVRIREKISDLRRELCLVQLQLRRFSATIQASRDQRNEWEKTVNDAYNSALGRAREKLVDFSKDLPEELLTERLENMTDPAEKKKVMQGLKMVTHLKETFALHDFSTWAAHENFGREEIIDGIGQIVSIIGIDDKIKKYLTNRWGLGKVLAFQEAADDLVISAYDVTAEVVAWRRLAQLNRNSEEFLTAIDKLGKLQRDIISRIHEREISLGLNPGQTREPCQ